MGDDPDDGRQLAIDSLHAGQEPDPVTGARAPPLYQTTSYVFEDAADAAAQFELSKPGYIYSRLMNPTVETLQERLAALEGGVGAAATASGMAALDLTTFLLASAGDNIVSASSLYGGTYTYLTHTVERRGVTTRFVDTLDYEAYREAIDEDTAYVHLETIGNPALDTPDIQRVADIAHEHGTPLFMDNTFATPALCRPLEHGADLVWDSTTKWLHGSGTTVGGVVVDGGSFPWADHAEKYPEIAADNPAYHGVNYAETFGEQASPTRPSPVGSVTSATSRPRSTPGRPSRGSRRSRCGWSATARTRWPSPSSSTSTRTWPGSTTPASSRIRPTTRPASTSMAVTAG